MWMVVALHGRRSRSVVHEVFMRCTASAASVIGRQAKWLWDLCTLLRTSITKSLCYMSMRARDVRVQAC